MTFLPGAKQWTARIHSMLKASLFWMLRVVGTLCARFILCPLDLFFCMLATALAPCILDYHVSILYDTIWTCAIMMYL